ncbi:MAG: hypothetical protein J7M40_08550, partial [Planctomycetes bacterium]|nr:hypothetical protein [Planctomycetota bacterium]
MNPLYKKTRFLRQNQGRANSQNGIAIANPSSTVDEKISFLYFFWWCLCGFLACYDGYGSGFLLKILLI